MTTSRPGNSGARDGSRTSESERLVPLEELLRDEPADVARRSGDDDHAVSLRRCGGVDGRIEERDRAHPVAVGGVRPGGVRPGGVCPRRVRPGGVRPRGVCPGGVRPRRVRPRGIRPGGIRPRGVRGRPRRPRSARRTARPLVGSFARKPSSAAFGFGGAVTAAASVALTSPTPIARFVMPGGLLGGEHERALHLVGRPVRVQREQLRRGARDDRGGERGARELHVVGRDDVVGPLRHQSCRSRRARSCSGRARRARAWRSRPRCGPRPTTGASRVVERAERGADVDRADRDHERVVAGRVEDAARAGRACRSCRPPRRRRRRSARASRPPGRAGRSRSASRSPSAARSSRP